MAEVFDFAITTIFAREVLEGSIIVGQYRTIILRGDHLPRHVTKDQALRAVTQAAILATAFAILVCVAVAIPLALLSNEFNNRTSKVIEGISKIVAAICILQLSLKFPKWLGVYASKRNLGEAQARFVGLSLTSIRFNVAWNIWREVAECGIFLLPFFLSGEGIKAVPLSAVIGTIVGLLLGLGIYYANKKLKNKTGLAIFASTLFLFFSTGLFTGGCHNLEFVFGETPIVWTLNGSFWSVNRLPMTVFKPFGYSDSRTVLQICCFWIWLALGCLLHYCKLRASKKLFEEQAAAEQAHLEDEEKVLREAAIDSDQATSKESSSVGNEPSLWSGSGDIEDQQIVQTEEFQVVGGISENASYYLDGTCYVR